MSRINETDSITDALMKLSDGNAGAMDCLMQVLEHDHEIDPDNTLGPVGVIWFIDSVGIYGSSLYILYSDQCGRSIRSFLMLLRACQLGFIDRETLQRVAADQTRSERIDLAPLDAQVCERLLQFQRPPVPHAETVDQGGSHVS